MTSFISHPPSAPGSSGGGGAKGMPTVPPHFTEWEIKTQSPPRFAWGRSVSPWLVGEQDVGFLVSSHFSSHGPGDKFEQNLKEADWFRCSQERVLPWGSRRWWVRAMMYSDCRQVKVKGLTQRLFQNEKRKLHWGKTNGEIKKDTDHFELYLLVSSPKHQDVFTLFRSPNFVLKPDWRDLSWS